MRVVSKPSDAFAFCEGERVRGMRVALVPTMGFLHEGHLSLLRLARVHADVVVLSIFVNPTQFGEGEDFERYPQDRDGDLAKAQSAGADLVFTPSPQDMYPRTFDTTVQVGALGEALCGTSRPGHFDGVATVVTKLFGIIRPQVGVFGQKDAQQLAIIERITMDLNLGVDIIGAPIAREPDGLAMSSRNVNLSTQERAQAPLLHQALVAARQAFEGGESSAEALIKLAERKLAPLKLGRNDYLEVRDLQTMALVDQVTRPALLAIAHDFEKARLIDNERLLPESPAA